MLIDRIMINNNNMLKPKEDYYLLYAYIYNPYTKDFCYIEVDEVQTIAEGYKYDRKFHYSQFTKKDFERSLTE